MKMGHLFRTIFSLISVMNLNVICLLEATTFTGFDNVTIKDVEAIVGRTAKLPCSIDTNSKEERVYMVLWFRHDGGKPLYSFDVRGRAFSTALHWSDPMTFGKRAYFVTISQPSALTIDSVQHDDEGIYRCRVDYKNSPTQNFQVKLMVVVPPHQLLLYDENKRDIAGVVGPLEIGSDFTLLCELKGGTPKPTLSWLIDNQTQDHRILRDDGKVIISQITVTKVDRSWLNKTVRCQAKNTNLMAPLERSARVEMNLRPSSVSIIKKPGQMTADSEVTLTCTSQGSRPPAVINWYKEKRKYLKGKYIEKANESSTISQLSMMVQPEDDGSVLRCRAENPILGGAIEDSFALSIVYKPVVTMSIGSTLNANDIKEGDDVYFECNIKSNPKEHRISWYHNDQMVTQNISSGIFISTKSLVLQKVTRLDGGLYSCRAANQIGETSSQPVYLRVQFAPVCSEASPVLIGARLDESLKIKCSVSADPEDVAFYWQFNNSGESFQVSPARFGATTSELKYRAASDRDYGSLLCKATNSVGEQTKPCVYQIVPAARPTQPRNCSAFRVRLREESRVSIRCFASYDGGLSQHFTLETIGKEPVVLANVTADYNDLTVWLNISSSVLQDLKENQLVGVFARNSKGASDPVIFKGLNQRDAELMTESTESTSRLSAAACLAALAAVLTASGALLILALRRRTESISTSKRPAQSMVQVDSRGNRYLIAYPTQEKTENHHGSKPDIINAKTEVDHPRVVLESNDNKSYTIRDPETSQLMTDVSVSPR